MEKALGMVKGNSSAESIDFKVILNLYINNFIKKLFYLTSL